MIQRLETGGDAGERRLPGDGQIAVARRVIGHGLSKAAGVFEVVVAPGAQLAQRVPRKQLGRRAPGGGLPRHRLGPVLAKLERGGVLRVRPGAAGAVESLWLVGVQEGAAPLQDRRLILQRLTDRFDGTPTPGGLLVATDPRNRPPRHRPSLPMLRCRPDVLRR